MAMKRLVLLIMIGKVTKEKSYLKITKKVSILENSSLKTDFFSLQGGIFNLDGDLITKKINIIRNKEINANEKSVFGIINKKMNLEHIMK